MRRHHALVLAAASLAALAGSAPLPAQQHAHPTPGLGTVRFATSCRPAVAPTFDRGIALLHSFEFGDAIRAFEEVARADSGCAMAHWGIALARWGNPMAAGNRAPAALARGSEAAAAATRLAAGATERERGYAAAAATLFADHARVDQRTRVLAYERATAELAARLPDDPEARIFAALAMVQAAPPTDKTYERQKRAGAILEALWRDQPDHPGLAHYIIHSYDVPALAPQAAAAARRYAGIAPAAAHALHMPSHTFTRLGLWEQSAETNRRSADAAMRTASLGEALHASDYLVYAYLQMRRDSAARAIVDALPAMAARFDPNAVTGAAPGSAGVFALKAIPARWALERRAWAEAAALEPAASPWPWTEAMTHFARALGSARTGRLAEARAEADSLDAIATRLAARGEGYWAEQVGIQALGARGWIALAEGRRDDAVARLREAATREAATEKSAVTPGPLAAARQQLGDRLLELGRAGDAIAEYRRTLEVEPNRLRALDVARRDAEAAGDRAAAAEYARALAGLTGR
ncbi:hypothetical protein [Roseisolibacter sp. H3M3-2]|uniref:hypothetical protein n=1 Tax=Roseisolibacter sp. H3M3-2 TaxID=3031323 RepID=UPI0023D9822B|nr:hypothetical protein [Roseisolibacter sp. H3M3-2]MDF1504803.1 hypothetical protein [Roseisolibacter sp. H3M3-2]